MVWMQGIESIDKRRCIYGAFVTVRVGLGLAH